MPNLNPINIENVDLNTKIFCYPYVEANSAVSVASQSFISSINTLMRLINSIPPANTPSFYNLDRMYKIKKLLLWAEGRVYFENVEMRLGATFNRCSQVAMIDFSDEDYFEKLGSGPSSGGYDYFASDNTRWNLYTNQIQVFSNAFRYITTKCFNAVHQIFNSNPLAVSAAGTKANLINYTQSNTAPGSAIVCETSVKILINFED